MPAGSFRFGRRIPADRRDIRAELAVFLVVDVEVEGVHLLRADGAKDLFREAQTVAREAKRLDLLGAARLGSERVRARQTALRKADILRRRLESNAGDSRSRMELIELAMIDLDDPNEAAKYVDESVPEPWTTYVPLSARAPKEVAPKAAMELGDWYRASLLPKANGMAKSYVAVGRGGGIVHSSPAQTIRRTSWRSWRCAWP